MPFTLFKRDTRALNDAISDCETDADKLIAVMALKQFEKPNPKTQYITAAIGHLNNVQEVTLDLTKPDSSLVTAIEKLINKTIEKLNHRSCNYESHYPIEDTYKQLAELVALVQAKGVTLKADSKSSLSDAMENAVNTAYTVISESESKRRQADFNARYTGETDPIFGRGVAQVQGELNNNLAKVGEKILSDFSSVASVEPQVRQAARLGA